jgi:hypothetical protein
VIQAQAAPLLGEWCDILEKPFQLEELLRKVQGHIGPPQLLETCSMIS